MPPGRVVLRPPENRTLGKSEGPGRLLTNSGACAKAMAGWSRPPGLSQPDATGRVGSDYDRPKVAHDRPGDPTADSVSAGGPGTTDDATSNTPASETSRPASSPSLRLPGPVTASDDTIGTRPLSPCLPGPLINRSGYVAFAATRPRPVPQVEPLTGGQFSAAVDKFARTPRYGRGGVPPRPRTRRPPAVPTLASPTEVR